MINSNRFFLIFVCVHFFMLKLVFLNGIKLSFMLVKHLFQINGLTNIPLNTLNVKKL